MLILVLNQGFYLSPKAMNTPSVSASVIQCWSMVTLAMMLENQSQTYSQASTLSLTLLLMHGVFCKSTESFEASSQALTLPLLLLLLLTLFVRLS